jgi:hypothetical protein
MTNSLTARVPRGCRNTFELKQFERHVPYVQMVTERRNTAPFVNLKSNPAAAHRVPELATDISLQALVVALNAPASGLLTLGCNSATAAPKVGFLRQGYVEFAINDTASFARLDAYFDLFVRFNETILAAGLSKDVAFTWAVMPLVFTEKSLRGFACSVGVSVHSLKQHHTGEEWEAALCAMRSIRFDVHLAREIFQSQ